MNKSVPIGITAGVELLTTAKDGVRRVTVKDPETRYLLSWDRYVRLNAAADAIKQLIEPGNRVFDVGGFDGALALFLPEYEIDLIDPSTTGASFLHEPAEDRSYDLVVSVDVLEHIDPLERKSFLSELARVASGSLVINYPCSHTKKAQELVLRATNNSLIKEHVEWELPTADWVLESLSEFGFEGRSESHSSLAIWLGQYLVHNLAPEVAGELNKFLIENHAAEPYTTALYELIICKRRSS